MSRRSRIEDAYRRVRITRYLIGVAAAGAFAAGAVVVRAAHPGSHGGHSGAKQAPVPAESSSLEAAAAGLGGRSDDSGSSGSSGSSVSPAPATSAPVIQSTGS